MGKEGEKRVWGEWKRVLQWKIFHRLLGAVFLLSGWKTPAYTDNSTGDTSVTLVEPNICPLGLEVYWTAYSRSTSLLHSCFAESFLWIQMKGSVKLEYYSRGICCCCSLCINGGGQKENKPRPDEMLLRTVCVHIVSRAQRARNCIWNSRNCKILHKLLLWCVVQEE